MGEDRFVNQGKMSLDHITIREWMATKLYSRKEFDRLDLRAQDAVESADALLKALHPKEDKQ